MGGNPLLDCCRHDSQSCLAHQSSRASDTIVIQRFHIEDLLVQDRSGVVFRALDRETGRIVALRRFLPFGPNGGGLQPDEQTAYSIAVERLSKLSHPALRGVLCGGCDPIDHIPFIVTEWVEGPPLSAFVDRAKLTPDEAAHLVSQALEVSELLSEVLAEEAVWIETDLDSIIVGAEGSGRGITFWISPLKWLTHQNGERGMEDIVTLTEEVMGWSKKRLTAGPAAGLAQWLNWLRASCRTCSLHETRVRLAEAAHKQPPTSSKELVRNAKQAAQPKPRKKFGAPVWLAASVVLLLCGGWGFTWWSQRREPVMAMPAIVSTMSGEIVPVVAEMEMPVSLGGSGGSSPSFNSFPAERTPESASRMAAALTTDAREASAARHAEISSRGGIFTPADHDLLVHQAKQQVTLEGVLQGVTPSSQGPKARTLYLQFSQDPRSPEPCGAVILKGAPDDLREPQLKPLIGKKIRLSGVVKIEAKANHHRPVVVIDKRSSIQEVK